MSIPKITLRVASRRCISSGWTNPLLPRTADILRQGGGGAGPPTTAASEQPSVSSLLCRSYGSSSPKEMGGSRRGSFKPKGKQTKKTRRSMRRRRGGGGGGGGKNSEVSVVDSDMFVRRVRHDEYYSDDGDFDSNRSRRKEPKLYYFRERGGSAADVPPEVQARMDADPTYFLGVDGLADNWTSPTVPPSRHPAVQAVLREILDSQRQRQNQDSGTGRNAFDGNLVFTLPKKRGGGTILSPVPDGDDVHGNSRINGAIAEAPKEDATMIAGANVDTTEEGGTEAEPAELEAPNEGAIMLAGANDDTIEEGDTELEGDDQPNEDATMLADASDDTIKEEDTELEPAELEGDDQLEPLTEPREAKKKDPNAPKRNLSAYVIYGQARRADLKADNPNVSFGEISKIIGTEWRILSDEERKVWDDRAAADKVRYEEEKEAYEREKGDQLVSGRWTDDEKRLFNEAMEIYGKGKFIKWKSISEHVGTRTSRQCKSRSEFLAGRDENGESTGRGSWTDSEIRLFNEAMEIYGRGKWKLISEYVGTRTNIQCKSRGQNAEEDGQGIVDASLGKE